MFIIFLKTQFIPYYFAFTFSTITSTMTYSRLISHSLIKTSATNFTFTYSFVQTSFHFSRYSKFSLFSLCSRNSSTYGNLNTAPSKTLTTTSSMILLPNCIRFSFGTTSRIYFSRSNNILPLSSVIMKLTAALPCWHNYTLHSSIVKLMPLLWWSELVLAYARSLTQR